MGDTLMVNSTTENFRKTRNSFENAWLAGLSSLLSGLIMVLFNRFHLPLDLEISLLMSVATINIVVAQKRFANKVILEQLNSRNAILRDHQDQTRRRADDLENPLLRMLARETLRQAQGTVNELCGAQDAVFLRTERDYTLYLSPKIRKLGNRDAMFAFCIGKAWKSAEIGKYFEENVKALKRGCKITRVFVDRGTFSEEQLQIIDKQKQAGATVLLLSAERLGEFVAEDHLPSDMGFVILDDEVLVHRGREGDQREVFILKSQFAIAVFRKLFAELQQASIPYIPRPR
jgi:hypothetical protein